MKIESLIKRQGGTVVDMDAPKRQYHFKPENDQPHEAPHVAQVDEDSHIRTLLRITEGYRPAEGEETPEFMQPGKMPNDLVLKGSNVHSASYPIDGGETIDLGDLVVMAYQDSGLTYEEWENLVDQERYDYIDATLRELQSGTHDQDDDNPQPEANKPPAPENNPPAGKPQEENGASGQQPDNNPPPEDNNGTDSKPPVNQAGEPSEEMTRNELVELFKKRFGREPARQMNKAEIVRALSEKDDD